MTVIAHAEDDKVKGGMWGIIRYVIVMNNVHQWEVFAQYGFVCLCRFFRTDVFGLHDMDMLPKHRYLIQQRIKSHLCVVTLIIERYKALISPKYVQLAPVDLIFILIT